MAEPKPAQAAIGFIKSIGVNQHLGWLGTVYDNVSLEKQELAYLGVSYVRDQSPASYKLSDYKDLASHNIKMDLVVGTYKEDIGTNLKDDLDVVDQLAVAYPGAIASIEGPNEVNAQLIYYNGVPTIDPNASVAVQIIKAISSTLQTYPNLKNIPLLNLTVSNGYANWQSYLANLGNLSAYVSGANWHTYFNQGKQPKANVTSMYQDALKSAPGKPVTFTEAGYFSAYKDTSGWGGVDEATQAKNTLNLLADAYQAGVQRTYLYELMEGVANPSSTDIENTFGLFHSDGTPKLVATSIHNLTSILNDIGSNSETFPVGSLNYSIANLPAAADSLLLQKSNGTFEIMIWNEAQNWDATAQAEVTVSAVPATVDLGATYANVKVFDPTQQAVAIQTLSNVRNVTLGLTDHPLIIEVVPGTVSTSIPTPAAIGSGSDTLVLKMSEDAYQGDAQFIVRIDGTQIGGAQTVVASHGSGQTESFTFKGNWGASKHAVAVNFVNDAYGGSVSTDRNLYIDSHEYNGALQSTSVALMSNGSYNFSL